MPTAAASPSGMRLKTHCVVYIDSISDSAETRTMQSRIKVGYFLHVPKNAEWILDMFLYFSHVSLMVICDGDLGCTQKITRTQREMIETRPTVMGNKVIKYQRGISEW